MSSIGVAAVLSVAFATPMAHTPGMFSVALSVHTMLRSAGLPPPPSLGPSVPEATIALLIDAFAKLGQLVEQGVMPTPRGESLWVLR